MVNNIQFKHFCGSLERWNAKISSSEYDSAIVFAKILDNGQWLNKIYAGKIYYGEDSSMGYLYDIPDQQELARLTNLVNIDGSTFTSQTFIEALENAINDSDLEARVAALEEHQPIVDSSINTLEKIVQWVEI